MVEVTQVLMMLCCAVSDIGYLCRRADLRRSYASMALPQPEVPPEVALELAEEVVLDWAAARPAAARTRAVVYCIVVSVFGER